MFLQKLHRIRTWLVLILLLSAAIYTVLMKNLWSPGMLWTQRRVTHATTDGNGLFVSVKPTEQLQVPKEKLKTHKAHSNNTQNPVTHVRFLKVHKCASSTIQNMLFRFALRYNLSLLLPKRDNHIMSKAQAVPLPNSKHFDIFAIHTVYKKKRFDSMLPNDSVNIAIVRDPLDRFISAAFYHRDVYTEWYLKQVPTVNYLHNLVQHPERYEPKGFSRTKNAMARDFGFSPYLTPIHTAEINKHLNFLDKEFSFVLIMEHFEESLVLLRRMMKWSLFDIIHLSINSHNHTNVTLTPSEISKLKQTCFLDYAIYDFFLKRFKTRLKTAGQRFYEEVAYFNRTLDNVDIFCNGNKGQPLLIEASEWNERFTVTREECSLMARSELTFIDHLRRRHFATFAKT